MNIAKTIQQTETTTGRKFDLAVLALIIYSVISISIETIPDLSLSTRRALIISDAVITILFTIEYVLRLLTAPKKLRYVFSFYGLVDLVAILPFYLALGFDLHPVRAFRLFRIFRILKLTRYSDAMTRFGRALSLAKEEALALSVATSVLLYLSAMGIYFF